MGIREELADKANAGNLEFISSKFEVVKNLFENSQPQTRNVAAETCSLWAQRFNRCLPSNASGLRDLPPIGDIDALISTVTDRWSTGDPSYKAALKKFVTNVFVARQKLDPSLSIQKLVDHVVSYAKDDQRICYGVLDSIARSSSENCAKLMQCLPADFLERSFKALVSDEGSNSHLIGRCLVGMLGHESPQKWYDLTEPFIASSEFYQPTMTYFIQPVLQQHRSASQAFEEYYTLCDSLRSRDPTVEIGVLKAAKNAKLEVGPLVQQSKVIKHALVLDDKRLRYDALQLLCCATRKLTTPVSPEVVDSIISAGPALLAEGDPKSRSDVISALRNLLIRLQTSKSSHSKLVEYIAEWCSLSLVPGAPYRCLAMATRLLALFKDYELLNFNDYPQLVHNLLNGILSDFADIRGACVALLEGVEIPALQSQLASVKALGFSLLESSRGGDAGARILEFLHSRFPEERIDQQVVEDLEAKLALADKDIHKASLEFSIHGYFIALRLFAVGKKAVELVEIAWEVCSPPLMALAPEGMDENTLNFSWKACKECALLIESCNRKLLSEMGPKRLLDSMALMLSDMTHWGAFSSIPPAFIAVAKCDPDYALHLVWQQINELESRQKSRSVTRRSAGLPMLITSSLTAKFDKSVVNALFRLATLPFAEGEAEELEMPQVHGMNCLRAVLTDAELTKPSIEFVESAVQLALQQFRSPSWSLRNCAAMLFSSLFKRLFGVRGFPIAASVFFQRYRSLKGIVLTQLLLAREDAENNMANDAVFPALSILAKLQTISATDDTLSVFWEPIITLLSSPSWKIREMAARVVGAMTHADSALDCVCAFVNNLSGRANEMHGYALAVNQLLEKANNINSTNDDTTKVLISKIEAILKHSQCMEVNVELVIAYKLLGGKSRVVAFEDLPKLPHLNPSIATFEAEQIDLSPPVQDISRYAHHWTPVLRKLPPSSWTEELATKVASDESQLPDIQALALQVLQSKSSDSHISTLAQKFIGEKYALEVRREALVLLAKQANASTYLANLSEFSADEAPVESRRSAAQSILTFFHSPANGAPTDELLYILYKLLSDEEEDIRDSSASALCYFAGLESVDAPAICENAILSKISSEYLTSKLVFNLVEDAKLAMQDANSSELFVIEEESLFRDELRSIRMQGEFCASPSEAQQKSVEEAATILGAADETPFKNASKEICRVRARINVLRK